MRLPSHHPLPCVLRQSARQPPPDAASDDDQVTGCGWFDSSHALMSGLHVTEHADTDTVANLVPLSWWLAWELDCAMQSAAVPR